MTWIRGLGGCEKTCWAHTTQHEHNPSPPKDQIGHCTNSGTCIIVCCYINGLGKVLWKGQEPKPIKGQPRPRTDFLRFQKFLHDCMNDSSLNRPHEVTYPNPVMSCCIRCFGAGLFMVIPKRATIGDAAGRPESIGLLMTEANSP